MGLAMTVEATVEATVTTRSDAREAPLPSGLPVETTLSLFFFFGGETSLPPSADVGGRRGRRRVASEAGITKPPQQDVALVKYSSRPRNPR